MDDQRNPPFGSRQWLIERIPKFLLCYFLFALIPLKYFHLSGYDYMTLEQLPFELSLTSALHWQNERMLPLCPALVEFHNEEGQAWGQIKRSGWFWRDDIFDLPNGSKFNDLDEKMIAHKLGLVRVGHWWKPADCTPVHIVTLIVPYRGRPAQLKKFILHIHPFLQLQKIQYRVVVVEQVDQKPFNKGTLFNVGFAESENSTSTASNCYILHDVDLLPENLRNVYGCTRQPRHMSAAVNSFRYLLSYKEQFGGVISITRHQFAEVNGLSNKFLGWGGEDDDLYGRLKNKNIDIVRLSPTISSYRMLPHKKRYEETENENLEEKVERGKIRYDKDGLNSLQYTVVNHVEGALYTLIQVKV